MASSSADRGRGTVGRLLRRHAAFVAVLVLAVAARVVVIAAYRPALLYHGDSPAYLDQAGRRLWAGDWRPSGYPMFLRVIGAPDHLTRLVVVQHMLTLLAGVALYAAVRRLFDRYDPAALTLARGRGGWPAALVAAPALLAPWVLDLGQFVLADSLFGTLVLGGVLALAWPGSPAGWRWALGGLLLGASVTVRTVGYGPIALGALGAIVLALRARTARTDRSPHAGRTGRSRRLPAGTGSRGAGAGAGTWREAGLRLMAGGAPVAAFVLAAAVPVVAYSAWSASQGKGFTVSAHSGFFLYGRVAPFADCARLPDDEDLRSLCDPRPVGERGSPVTYLWPDDSLLRQGNDLVPPGREELAGEFAGEMIRTQPWTMVTSTARYLGGYFWPVRYETVLTSRADTWELPQSSSNRLPDGQPHATDGYFTVRDLNDHLAGPLASYSGLSYAAMPLVGLGLLGGLAAGAVGWRRGRPGPGRLFWLTAGAGLSTLLLASLTSAFDYRYLGSVTGLLGPAAVLGGLGLFRVLPASSRPRPAVRGTLPADIGSPPGSPRPLATPRVEQAHQDDAVLRGKAAATTDGGTR
ncbi:hypothetical protein CC117_25135 [Parafrankia colletiae]|uniref:Glycosyltransferase RgtA/B/C/D-like domain-containing protein n=1 Tax=Parafrankia colletiae TaxID=573497 RepID=A0A1S1QC27_9ACTN|nr:hypothetical protein [Parafrankia colletiae]MCK9902706.1 hypothetical protein [Frankia sp. Cpl3]OHV32358.1 hypothetical protein CC117_25135 [Parafrankia colletiae]